MLLTGINEEDSRKKWEGSCDGRGPGRWKKEEPPDGGRFQRTQTMPGGLGATQWALGFLRRHQISGVCKVGVRTISWQVTALTG